VRWRVAKRVTEHSTSIALPWLSWSWPRKRRGSAFSVTASSSVHQSFRTGTGTKDMASSPSRASRATPRSAPAAGFASTTRAFSASTARKASATRSIAAITARRVRVVPRLRRLAVVVLRLPWKRVSSGRSALRTPSPEVPLASAAASTQAASRAATRRSLARRPSRAGWAASPCCRAAAAKERKRRRTSVSSAPALGAAGPSFAARTESISARRAMSHAASCGLRVTRRG